MARGQDVVVLKDATSAAGPRLVDAGHQSFEDCGLFALANAAGLPYSVVATRATDFLSKGTWSYDPERRTNIQSSIEKHGLNGFEVIFLAEIFGRASVIDNKDLVQNISEGHPVIVDVVPSGGVSLGGHAVVLAQTFTHAGETWFVMMDSNLDPQQRWYLSAKELNVIQQEKGITFTTEPKTTPALLRDEEKDCCYNPAQEH